MGKNHDGAGELEKEYKHTLFHLKSLLFPKSLLVILFLLIFANLLFLDLQIRKLSPFILTKPTSQAVPSVPVRTTATLNQSCPVSCLDQIQKATSSGTASQQIQTISNAPANNTSKEFFISLGQGTNSSSDWQDVVGLSSYIDSTSYTNVKKVTFEASVHVPTGNQTASVRLFNATDGHPVWFSEVLFNSGGTPALLISDPITLDPGNKLYKVQMKTQLQFTAYLDQSKVHIITF